MPSLFALGTHRATECRCHACQLGLEGIVSKRLGSRYRSGRWPDWLKMKNPAALAVKREAEEDWARTDGAKTPEADEDNAQR